TSNGPEQIGLFVSAYLQYMPLGGDEFDGAKIVEGQAVLAHQPAHSTAEGEASDSGAGHHTAGNRQAVQLRLAIELGPGHATLSPRSPSVGIDVNAFHPRQVDHQSALYGRPPRHIMTAATDCHLKAQLSREGDSVN